jgi:hypothetical protein
MKRVLCVQMIRSDTRVCASAGGQHRASVKLASLWRSGVGTVQRYTPPLSNCNPDHPRDGEGRPVSVIAVGQHDGSFLSTRHVDGDDNDCSHRVQP